MTLSARCRTLTLTLTLALALTLTLTLPLALTLTVTITVTLTVTVTLARPQLTPAPNQVPAARWVLSEAMDVSALSGVCSKPNPHPNFDTGPKPKPDPNAHADPEPNPNPYQEETARMARGGFLAGVERFDGKCFGVSPAEASAMDPQQRLVLEVAYEALHGAGARKASLLGDDTGVFLGIERPDWALLQAMATGPRSVYAATGAASPSPIPNPIPNPNPNPNPSPNPDPNPNPRRQPCGGRWEAVVRAGAAGALRERGHGVLVGAGGAAQRCAGDSRRRVPLGGGIGRGAEAGASANACPCGG